MNPPRAHHWLFWDVDPSRLEVKRDRDYILARVLEFGRMEDVNWVLSCYGMDGVHEFLRDCGHPELSPRTLAFWRVVLKAKNEPWATSRRSRVTNVAVVGAENAGAALGDQRIGQREGGTRGGRSAPIPKPSRTPFWGRAGAGLPASIKNRKVRSR